MIKKIAAVMLSVCMSTAMAAGAQAADFTSGEETLEGTFTDGSKDDQTGDISEIANDIVAQAEEKAQEYQKLKEEADRAAAKKAAEERARKAEEERVAHRQEIVDFAMQFEGNPYVYGGTSLTNGADCSGFMMSVFKEFGYELPKMCIRDRSCLLINSNSLSNYATSIISITFNSNKLITTDCNNKTGM